MGKISRRTRENRKQVDPKRRYTVEEAVGVLKGLRSAKFDETVELAIKLQIDGTKADQQVRGSFSMPKGIGRLLKVIAFAEGAAAEAARAAGAVEVGGEDLVEKIIKGWTDFDVAIAHPQLMRSVGKLGRLLGPQGKMPSPKSGTVTPDVGKAVGEFRAGRVEFRTDNFGNLHVPVGKVSFAPEALVTNIRAFLDHLLAIRPAAVRGIYLAGAALSSTMGPGVRLVVQA